MKEKILIYLYTYILKYSLNTGVLHLLYRAVLCMTLEVIGRHDKILVGNSFRNSSTASMTECLQQCLSDCLGKSFQTCEKKSQLCSTSIDLVSSDSRKLGGCNSLEIRTSAQKVWKNNELCKIF